MKKRYLTVAAGMACILAVAAVGCGGKSMNNVDSGAAPAEASTAADMEVTEEYDYAEEASDAAGAVTSEEGIDPVVENGRKLIKTVRLEMQTKEFDALMEGLRGKIREMNGYIENSSVWGSNYEYSSARRSEYTVRIPADRLDEFIEVVSELGNVTYKSEGVEDVTLQYVDVESRQKALETEQTRLLELLEQADNLEDLLTIESRLSEVRYELENYGSQKRLLDNQIDYSTVHMSISEVERITEVGEKSFFEEIADLFGDNLYHVGRGLRGFVIVLIGSLPVLAVWAVVIAGFVLVIRKVFYGKKTDRKSGWRKKATKDAVKEENNSRPEEK